MASRNDLRPTVDQLLERIERVVRCIAGILSEPRCSFRPCRSRSTLRILCLQPSIARPYASVSRVNQKIYEIAARNDGVHVLDLFMGRNRRQDSRGCDG